MKLLDSQKGFGTNKLIGILTVVLIFMSMIGLMANNIQGLIPANKSIQSNVSATAFIIISLTTVFLGIGFIMYIVKETKS